MLALAIWVMTGLVYDFDTTVTDERAVRRFSGRVTVSGIRYRVEMADGDIVISNDGDKTAFLYDAETGSWSQRRRLGVTRSSMLFQLPIPGNRLHGKPRVKYIAAGTERIEGRIATRHTIEIAYGLITNVDDAKVRGEVRATVRVWADPSLPPLPMERGLKTGFDRVDREIVRASFQVKGMVLRHELDVSRSLEAGPVVMERTVTTTRNVAIVDVPDSAFEALTLPKGI